MSKKPRFSPMDTSEESSSESVDTPITVDMSSVLTTDISSAAPAVVTPTVETKKPIEPLVIESPVSNTPVSRAAAAPSTKFSQPKPQEGSKTDMNIIRELDTYKEEMDSSKAINPERGAEMQKHLYHVLIGILNSDTQEKFNEQYSTVLNYFYDNRDNIFNENWIFRFAQHWDSSKIEYDNFRRLVFTIIQTANPQTRVEAMKYIDLHLLCQDLKANQKERIVNFYS